MHVAPSFSTAGSAGGLAALVLTYENIMVNCRLAKDPKTIAGWTLKPRPNAVIMSRNAFDVAPKVHGFFRGCIKIGWSEQDGADTLALNLNPGPNYGKVLFASMSLALDYGCPIIGDSVTEFLQLAYRPVGVVPYYFLEPGFDRGPLIPAGYFRP